MLEQSDPIASVVAHQHLRDLVGDTDAEAVLRTVSVDFERKDGLRRLVLAGEWEVDPLAVKAA